jgi:hypothetical protein
MARLLAAAALLVAVAAYRRSGRPFEPDHGVALAQYVRNELLQHAAATKRSLWGQYA